MKRYFSILLALAACMPLWAQQHSIDLSGSWELRLDREDCGEAQRWWNVPFDDSILLPGSMPQRFKGDDVSVETRWTGSLYDSTYYFNPRMAAYRRPGNVKFPFFLTPDKHYVGAAWYRRTVTVPADWKGGRVEFYMERPHIETTVWVDGRKVGVRNSLSTGHSYDLTGWVTPGRQHTLTVRVDNRLKPEYNVGQDSHSVSDQTQGNWNGIVGRIELKSYPKTFFSDIQVYPDVERRQAVVKMTVESASAVKGRIVLSARSFNAPAEHRTGEVSREVALRPGANRVEMTLPMGEGMLLWDEFSPALYRLSASLEAGKMHERKEIRFGMREFGIEGKYFRINGRKTMLRGTVENCDFPQTGYAPMDVESWIRVFRICREYGLNHMRFHSYCPPAAAFEAADLVGFYLQPEGPSWPNHGVKLGMGDPIDEYLMEETRRMSKEYGSSPSFCMLACGNEPSGRWVEWVTDFVEYWEKNDPRRVYTGASVGGSWQWQPRNQYHVKAGARGLAWNRSMPESMSDYRERIDTVSQPYVSHETGQWCVFPNFSEIRKYTGVNKAGNFEIFRDLLEENGMGHLAHDFMMASGKLQALCYKHEIEKTLRTPDYAGFQLLSLNDYSGQGSALVGVTDVFFDAKEYISADEWRRFCNSTVPLVRMPRFVFTDGETLRARVEAAHFGPERLENVTTTYKVKDSRGTTVAEGTVGRGSVEPGSCRPLGEVELPLAGWKTPMRYNLEVAIAGTEFVNDWDFWVYPAQAVPEAGDVLVTEDVEEAMRRLADGGKVLLVAPGGVSYGSEIKQQLTPVFWNTSWFKMRPPHTTGILVDSRHPAFDDFPTEYHSDLQWWELVNQTTPMRLSEFPDGFQPLVQSIDTWFLSRKAGMLFEARVGRGRLMMTTMDLTSRPEERVVARQMLRSLLRYMNSDRFRPATEVAEERVRELYTRQAPAIDFGTKESPDELRPNVVR